MKALAEGVYDELVSEELRAKLAGEEWVASCEALHPDSAPDALAAYLAGLLRSALRSHEGPDAERMRAQLALANDVIELLAKQKHLPVDTSDRVTAEKLVELLNRDGATLGTRRYQRPQIPLRVSELIVNGPRDVRVGAELAAELASADRVEMLVSFIKWTGIIELQPALLAFAARHGGAPPLRVLTTTYMGATDARAIEWLRDLGAEVRVSYDGQSTRLHAKAWLFHRDSGYSTAFVGSSNLSRAALKDGCEWNVRVSSVVNQPVVKKIESTFDQYWNSEDYAPYSAQRFAESTRKAPNRDLDVLARLVRLRPYEHQQSVLDALATERDAGHTRNLVVAATGTGKTVMAALDYARQSGRPSLLFVAHRKEIIEKARATFRLALQDGNFGELLSGGHEPVTGTHVFATIQSLTRRRLNALPPSHYAFVVVDEFHHSEAATWTRLLNHVEPAILLGMTATPERNDGQSVLHWFDDRIAAESRLWDALDRGQLVPFQYFGVHDETDISHVDFRAGRYDISALENVYTADDHRAKQVLGAVHKFVLDATEMRALAFCVSVRHAEFMSAFFNRHGIASAVVCGTTSSDAREAAVRDLQSGQLAAICTVDVFNEGIDIPRVDTVLFLRPTESPTLFLQQLGRGLRHAEGKSCLTVLDFVARPNAAFRYDRRFRALLPSRTRSELQREVQRGFPFLPQGCSIQLDETAQKTVLRNLRMAIASWRTLAEDLIEDMELDEFIARSGVELSEIYRKGKSFTQLRHLRGYTRTCDDKTAGRLARLLYVDDPVRLSAWAQLLSPASAASLEADDPEAAPHYAHMLQAALGLAGEPVLDAPELRHRLAEAGVLDETRALLEVLRDRLRRPTYALPKTPLRVHATYARDEVSAALGLVSKGKLLRTQAGVYKATDHAADILFVTLEKVASEFSPTTLYNDYVMSPRRFHWESQSVTRADSETGKRYVSPPEGWRILLFVRERRKDERGLTMPYLFLGPAQCVSAKGERPIQIIWELERPMPDGWYSRTKVAAG